MTTTDYLKEIYRMQDELNRMNENLIKAAFRLGDDRVAGSFIALKIARDNAKELTERIDRILEK